MYKYFFILIILLVIGCSENNKQPEVENNTQTDKKQTAIKSDVVNTNITDFKINEDVPKNKDNSSEFIEEEGKVFVSPTKLFDYYPLQFEGLELSKNSSGVTSSGLGKYTTSTGVMRLGEKYLRLRLSDFYDGIYFPELNLVQNVPPDDANYNYREINEKEYIGFIQWHNAADYGIINVFIYDRFNLFIEMDGYPEMSVKYKELIEKFDLKKLKNVKNSNG